MRDNDSTDKSSKIKKKLMTLISWIDSTKGYLKLYCLLSLIFGLIILPLSTFGVFFSGVEMISYLILSISMIAVGILLAYHNQASKEFQPMIIIICVFVSIVGISITLVSTDNYTGPSYQYSQEKMNQYRQVSDAVDAANE